MKLVPAILIFEFHLIKLFVTGEFPNGRCYSLQLCQKCSCEGTKSVMRLTCRFVDKSLLEALKAYVECLKDRTIELTFQMKTESRSSFILPWKAITVKPRLALMDLRQTTLSCSCFNAWIRHYDRVLNSSLVPDLGWRQEFQNSTLSNIELTTAAYTLNFPKQVLLPDTSRCTPDGSASSLMLDFEDYIKNSCDLAELTLNRRDPVLTCSASSDISKECTLFLKIVNGWGRSHAETSNCTAAISYNFSAGKPEDSGWAICILDSPYLPETSLTRIAIPGKPKLLELYSRKASKTVEISIKILSADPLNEAWLYLMGREVWDIIPNYNYRFRMWKMLQFPDGFMIHHYTLEFLDPELHCTSGYYILQACNPHDCLLVNFQVNSTRGQGFCARINITLGVKDVFFDPPLNDSAIPTTQESSTTKEPEHSLSEADSRWVFMSFILLALFFLLALVTTCLVIRLVRSGYITGRLCCNRKHEPRIVLSSETAENDLAMNDWTSQCLTIQMQENAGYISWLNDIKQKKAIAIIPPEELQMVRQLGEGAFGCVHLVKWINAPTLPPKRQKMRRSSSLRRAVFNSYGTSSPYLSSASLQVGSASRATSPLLSSAHRKRLYSASSNCSNSEHGDSTVEMAMKLLKYVTQEKLKDLEREASVLTELNHPNIVQFYGMTVQGNEGFALLFEYMEHGDLVHYLRNHNPDLLDPSSDTKPLIYTDLLQISMQVASGLEYLAQRHLVHRDLAARNCLVGQGLIVKLSDFGMTRDLYVTDYYRMGGQTLVPLRWLPPESVIYRKFTTESDVWSLGVLLWEVFSYGQVPWYAYSNSEVLELVKEGRILEKPEMCGAEVYESLILACCKHRPNERLSASEAKEILESLLETALCYCSVQRTISVDVDVTNNNEWVNE